MANTLISDFIIWLFHYVGYKMVSKIYYLFLFFDVQAYNKAILGKMQTADR